MSVLKSNISQTLNLSKNIMLIHLIKTGKFQRVPFGNNLMWYMISTLLPIKEKLRRTDWLIDQIVYKLYGLTEEEIKIVEER